METQVFVCSYENCSKAFNNKYNLIRHIRCLHEGLKRFACDFCGLKLASRQTKVEHEYLHTGERPYLCTEFGCGLRFRQSSQLSVHRKGHLRAMDQLRQIEFPSSLPEISIDRAQAQYATRLPLPPKLS